jgi:glycerol-3-phosphate dehydrogenase (NAD(P)+)
MSDDARIAVLGAGSWGGTLTWLLGSAGKHVSLWTHSTEKLQQLQETRRLGKPLPISIPEGVSICEDLNACVSEADVIIFACTAQSMRSVAQKVQAGIDKKRKDVALVSVAKGLELGTDLRMTEILSQAIPSAAACALSGPNLAAEILNGLPCASVVACEDEAVARRVQEALSVPTMRLYTNTDVIGVEVGGALKNVIAIAAGVVDGFDLGTNAKAGLMTRGLAEMTRMAVAKGAQAITLSGLAGMGDLVATCYSSLSRNYRLGYRVARGDSVETAQRELGATAEGITTARAVCELSKKLGIELPIAQQVDMTLRGLSAPKQAIMSLMTRPLASE